MPSSHQIMTLKKITQESIVTVKNMRSYIGLYKVFFKSHRQQASVLADLNESVSAKDTKDKIVWTSELKDSFEDSKKQIENIEPRTIPTASDLLVISKDAALGSNSIRMILWAVRNNEWLLDDCYSFRITD